VDKIGGHSGHVAGVLMPATGAVWQHSWYGRLIQLHERSDTGQSTPRWLNHENWRLGATGPELATRTESAVSKTLFILNDPPYGTERSYNGLRLAAALAKRGDGEVRVFLMGDAVSCAMANQKLPDGYYHLDRMIGTCARHGADIACCGTCMDARGITEDMLTKGARRSTLDELAD
jgi:uncharacterized protein involved in oxidation of intracellular sulfur